MTKALTELSTRELEELVEHAIDRRLEVWSGLEEEDRAEFQPEFAASQARPSTGRTGSGIDLQTFRDQIGQ